MKKFFLSLGVVALMAVSMTSCSKSNEDLINEYKDLCTETAAAVKSKDLSKVQSLAAKGEELEKELKSRDLTKEEKERVDSITNDLAEKVASSMSQGLGF